MERYIRMDVHAASCTLAVISEKGRRLRDFPVETNGQALVEAIRMIPGHKHLVFEEKLQSAWLYETLIPHVDELVVAGITQSRGPKSDKRDAYGLAEKLRVGNLDKHVFKAPRQFAQLRELSRTYMTLVGDVVRTQARIKSVYRSRGVLVTGIDVYSSRRRGEWLRQLPSSTQLRATRLYAHLDFLMDQKKHAEADLLREGKKHSSVKILETAPGFGPIRAARLVPIVITPHRFRTKRQFWSYCGLDIVTRSSSDWVQTTDGAWIKARTPQTRGLTQQHNRFLKAIFKGAATTVVTQRNKDPIHARSERLLDGGTKPTLAKLSLARMIAATVLGMWKNEQEYDPGRAGLPTQTRKGEGIARSGESMRRQSFGTASAKRVRKPRIAWSRRRASMFVLANDLRPEGPTAKRWPAEAQMGDGAHFHVEITDAEHSRCDGLACEPNTRGEPLEKIQSLLELNDELNVSSRDSAFMRGAAA